MKATGADNQIRAFAAISTNLVEEARKRHDTSPVATAALGRTLTGALLLGNTLKGDDTLTIRILGDGPLGGIIANANSKGEVRGYVQEPHVELPLKSAGKLDVGKAVGKGFLYITKDLGLKEPYTGSSEIISGEIAEDLNYYLFKSEQTPSVVSLGVLVDVDRTVKASGGYIVQLMPGASEEIIGLIESNINKIDPVSTMIDNGLNAEEILTKVMEGLEIKILDKQEVDFQCKCSKERLEKVLISLGKEELKGMIEEQAGAELTCHFCSDVHNFNAEELEKLICECTTTENAEDTEK